MPKKNDMDHMKSILGHAASANPAPMPRRPNNPVTITINGKTGTATPARMPRPDAPSTITINGKTVTATPARMPRSNSSSTTSMQTGKPVKVKYK